LAQNENKIRLLKVLFCYFMHAGFALFDCICACAGVMLGLMTIYGRITLDSTPFVSVTYGVMGGYLTCGVGVCVQDATREDESELERLSDKVLAVS